MRIVSVSLYVNHVYAVPVEARRWSQILSNWSYRRL